MKSEIINVSFNNKSSNLSYPIFVGTRLLSDSEKFIKVFVQNRKVILIHDNFFSQKKMIMKFQCFCKDTKKIHKLS